MYCKRAPTISRMRTTMAMRTTTTRRTLGASARFSEAP
nr:MAG TPA_asm: hypothetical protein [Caudoviricetes sp.]